MPRSATLRHAATATLLAITSVCANADDAERARRLVGDSRRTLAHFNTSPNMRVALQDVPSASAVPIFPNVMSAASIVGGSGADGLLFVRDLDTGHWTGPAFHHLFQGEASDPDSDRLATDVEDVSQ